MDAAEKPLDFISEYTNRVDLDYDPCVSDFAGWEWLPEEGIGAGGVDGTEGALTEYEPCVSDIERKEKKELSQEERDKRDGTGCEESVAQVGVGSQDESANGNLIRSSNFGQ